MTPAARSEQHAANTDANNNTPPPASTLIEFPTPGRAPRPQWRKELSERVREIQQRKAQEAAREAEAAAAAQAAIQSAAATTNEQAVITTAQPASEPTAPALGLVPSPPPAPALNPIVVEALKRVERARQRAVAPSVRGGGGGRGPAAATARVAREDYEVAPEPVQPAPVEERAVVVAQAVQIEQTAPEAQTVAPEPVVEPVPVEAATEAVRAVNLVVVPPAPQPEATVVEEREKVRRHIPIVLDEAYLARREATELALDAPAVPDHAPVVKRVVGSIIDLFVVAFAASPFAAIIELTNGNWSDPRVVGSLAGIIVILMFLYLMASTALAGRTWGMSLVALRTVDANTGHAPSIGQCSRRAIGYMMALATGGLGFLCALFDRRGRALQDFLSGTINVRE
jgi:uncharacterized RDD family membrane protein YckC